MFGYYEKLFNYQQIQAHVSKITIQREIITLAAGAEITSSSDSGVGALVS